MVSTRLNLGCGDSHLKGFINIDCRSEVNPDICSRIEDLDYITESIKEIYASHVLEHTNYRTIKHLLNRFYSWLEHGGKLFVAVPNMVVLGDLLDKGYNDEILFNWIFGRDDISPAHGHKWGFTDWTLRRELISAGFQVVRYFNSPYEDDSKYRFYGNPLSLNLECVKL